MRISLILAMIFLSGCGGAALKKAVKELRASNCPTRARAAAYLINNGGAQVLPEVAEVLKEDFPEVRRDAVFCLSHLKDDQAIPHLVAMENDKDRQVRATAVSGLSHFGPRGVSALLELISPGHKEDVRARAALVLGLIGDTAHFETLESLVLKPTAPDEARAGAARGIGCLKDRRSQNLLIQVLDDARNSSAVRCGAAFGLVANFMFTEDRIAIPYLDRIRGNAPYAQLRSCAAMAYSELSEPTNLAGYCKLKVYQFQEKECLFEMPPTLPPD